MIRPITLLAMLGLLILPGRSNSEPLPDPGMPDGEEHHYRVQFVGGAEERPEEVPFTRKALEHLTLVGYGLKVEHTVFQGRKAYKIIRTEKLKNGDTAVETLILLREPKGLFTAEIRRKHLDAKGKLCKNLYVDVRAPTLKYPNDIVHYMAILTAGRAIALRPKGSRINFPLYLGDLNLVKAYMKALGPENIKIGDTEFQTLKVEMSALLTSFLGDKFWVRQLQKFIPKLKYWFLAEPPHHLIRYEAGLGGLGAPVEVNEIIK